MKKYKIMTAVIMAAMFMGGCGNSAMDGGYQSSHMDSAAVSAGGAAYNSYSMDYEIAAEDDMSMDIAESDVVKTKEMDENKQIFGDKLVYTCNISMETLEYDKAIESIKAQVNAFGGLIQGENEYDNAYNWYYSDYQKTNATRNMMFTIRVPSDKYEEFLGSIEGSGKIVSRSASIDNISKQYYDTETIIKSLKIQEERLLDMMEQAETIEDMIAVESRLTEVQMELNQYQTSLSSMQMDVDYSTVYISVQEVFEYTPETYTNTFFDRLGNALKSSWDGFKSALENILFFVIIAVPQLIVFVPVIGVAVFLIIKAVKFIKRRVRK